MYITDSEAESSGALELIEELINNCGQYDEKIVALQEIISQKSKQLDLTIKKFQDLDRLAKNLDESISLTRSRSIKEMEKTIDTANGTTERIVEKMPSIRSRINDKSEVLKQQQELLTTFQNQVEREKRSVKMLAKYRNILGGKLTYFFPYLVNLDK
ncbi:8914_t:CDS:2 [Diversispora eburnea]|uniref:8914_t:CDS:1 n=1 Tax=Diversispora eburnea TaxID=1213867 RepID=A0A9N8Z071_9GLOM|nr:8914_t:CDS:2 [Diversispora eburnea]